MKNAILKREENDTNFAPERRLEVKVLTRCQIIQKFVKISYEDCITVDDIVKVRCSLS